MLSKVGVFSLLAPAEVKAVAEHLTTATLAAGETLFREGDRGDELYILMEGAAAVSIRLPDGGDREIARFAPGDFFGEMSIFDNAPRSATCIALEKTTLSLLSKKAFGAIISEHPRIALKLMYRMLNVTTQRLRGTSEFVSEMVLWGESARKRAVTDELTGVYNRRFLEDSLGSYVAEAREKGERLSLVMVDLDHFREINELYGHGAGDQTIKDAARVFRTMARETDVIARYGGDEFVIVLPKTDPERATRLMEKVCAGVSALETLKDKKGKITGVTTSMGVAGYPLHASDLSALRAAADAALYRAKEGGGTGGVRGHPAGSRRDPHHRQDRHPRHSGEEPDHRADHRGRDGKAPIPCARAREPDDDCVSSMISFGLLLHMFSRDVSLYLGRPGARPLQVPPGHCPVQLHPSPRDGFRRPRTAWTPSCSSIRPSPR